MISVNIGIVKIKHDEKCYNDKMEDVQIGYKCMVCGLFLHKKAKIINSIGNIIKHEPSKGLP